MAVLLELKVLNVKLKKFIGKCLISRKKANKKKSILGSSELEGGLEIEIGLV